MTKFSVVPRFLVVFLATCVALPGCGGSGGKLYPVKGKVTVDGPDLKAGVITYVPDKAKGNTVSKGPVGSIGKDGTYAVTTDGKDGAPLGWYKVTVVTQMPGMDAGPAADPSKPPTLPSGMGGDVNKSYASAETTTLRIEVVASPTPGQYDLKVSK